MRRYAQVVAILAAMAGLLGTAQTALSQSKFVLQPDAMVVEPGQNLAIELQGNALGYVSAYQAQLALPAGVNCTLIDDGNVFGAYHMVTTTVATPRLSSMLMTAPYYASADPLKTLATFHLNVPADASLGTRTIGTIGSAYLNELGRKVGSVSHDSFVLTVAAPDLALTQYDLSFGQTVVGFNKQRDTIVTNAGLMGTMLNGLVTDAQLLLYNNEPAGSMANPFTLVDFGLGMGFDLAGQNSESRTFGVQFAPLLEGHYVGYFDIISDDGVGGPGPVGSATRVYFYGEAVPEPATIMLMASGLATFALRRASRRKTAWDAHLADYDAKAPTGLTGRGLSLKLPQSQLLAAGEVLVARGQSRRRFASRASKPPASSPSVAGSGTLTRVSVATSSS